MATVGRKPRVNVVVSGGEQGLFCPIAIDPHQFFLIRLKAAGNVNERSRTGKIVLSESGSCGLQNALHHGDCRTGDRKTLEIEWHGHQAATLRKDQVSGGRVVRGCPWKQISSCGREL